MKAPYFVEILSRSKEVLHRHRIDSLPIRIGRSYDNDVILDDQHIAAFHAIVAQDIEGAFLIRDQGSRNGITVNGLRKSEIQLDDKMVFQLGYTYLRIRAADSPVSDEERVSSLHRWDGWPPAVLGVVIITLLTCLIIWTGDTEKFEVSNYLIYSLFVLLVCLVWSGIWAFINRLFGEMARLGRHIFILACGFIAWCVISYSYELAAYIFSLDVITRYSSHIDIAVLSTTVFFHLQQIKPNRTLKFARAAVIFSLMFSAVVLLLNYKSDKMFADELFMNTRFPPGLRLTADKPVAKFLENVASLKVKVDNDRNKVVNEEEIDDKVKD
jgi:hypothetical protein